MIIVAFPYKKQEEPYLNDSMKKYFKGIDKKNKLCYGSITNFNKKHVNKQKNKDIVFVFEAPMTTEIFKKLKKFNIEAVIRLQDDGFFDVIFNKKGRYIIKSFNEPDIDNLIKKKVENQFK